MGAAVTRVLELKDRVTGRSRNDRKEA
jgi:hypothetical protein